jgi:hypothetical protein
MGPSLECAQRPVDLKVWQSGCIQHCRVADVWIERRGVIVLFGFAAPALALRCALNPTSVSPRPGNSHI